VRFISICRCRRDFDRRLASERLSNISYSSPLLVVCPSGTTTTLTSDNPYTDLRHLESFLLNLSPPVVTGAFLGGLLPASLPSKRGGLTLEPRTLVGVTSISLYADGVTGLESLFAQGTERKGRMRSSDSALEGECPAPSSSSWSSSSSSSENAERPKLGLAALRETVDGNGSSGGMSRSLMVDVAVDVGDGGRGYSNASNSRSYTEGIIIGELGNGISCGCNVGTGAD
jgi:hypothetical protein